MIISNCSIEGCKRKKHAQSLCIAHYMRWIKKGDVGNAKIRKWEKKPTYKIRFLKGDYISPEHSFIIKGDIK